MTTRALALSLLFIAACDKPARVELKPASIRFGVLGQKVNVHAAPFAKNGRAVPDQRCRWSSTDEKVATVAGPANDVVVSAIGPGSCRIRCSFDDVTAELEVLVRIVSKVEISPQKVELKMLDEPEPYALKVTAQDDTGAPVLGRAMLSRCTNEEICRGDGRGQLWGISAGDTTAFVEIEGARSQEIAVHVVDARSADAKPKPVKGNPMEAVEREYLKKLADQKKAEEKRKAEEARKSGN